MRLRLLRVFLLTHGLRLGLEPLPFHVDTAFCLFTGAEIWLLRTEANDSSQMTRSEIMGYPCLSQRGLLSWGHENQGVDLA